ncbi:MAG: hypothetical protein IJP28_00885 [Erysipelotrichales bacterium]|nr:hypothetical protein [Erysipelotrichales bacterium]
MNEIKELIKTGVEKIMKDDELQVLFKKDPVKAVEKIYNVDLPDEVINPVIDGIKAKLAAEKLSDAASMLKKFMK